MYHMPSSSSSSSSATGSIAEQQSTFSATSKKLSSSRLRSSKLNHQLSKTRAAKIELMPMIERITSRFTASASLAATNSSHKDTLEACHNLLSLPSAIDRSSVIAGGSQQASCCQPTSKLFLVSCYYLFTLATTMLILVIYLNQITHQQPSPKSREEILGEPQIVGGLTMNLDAKHLNNRQRRSVDLTQGVNNGLLSSSPSPSHLGAVQRASSLKPTVAAAAAARNVNSRLPMTSSPQPLPGTWASQLASVTPESVIKALNLWAQVSANQTYGLASAAQSSMHQASAAPAGHQLSNVLPSSGPRDASAILSQPSATISTSIRPTAQARWMPITVTSQVQSQLMNLPGGQSVRPKTVDEQVAASNPLASYYHHQGNPRPTLASAHQRQWRRPRLNNAHPFEHSPRPSQRAPNYGLRIYKRVLVCDKTLVSLDYLGNFPTQAHHRGPRPGHHPAKANEHGYNFNEMDDNFIDLDSEMAPIYVNQALANNTFADQMSMAQQTVQYSTRSDGPILEAGSYFVENREPLLSDKDPLVRCDMWDLEKGLKKRKPPAKLLAVAIKTDFDTVRDAINRCRQLTEKLMPNDDEYRDGLELMTTEDLMSLFSMKRGLIPGTKWCGLGDMADSYNDLGPKHRIDLCCRAHDHCPIRLKPFRNDYGILNLALYTKSHCDCDADFYRCLREVRSRTADMLGNLYFNVMKLQCMRQERVKGCRETRPVALGFGRCARYEDNPTRTVFRFTTPPVAY